MRNYDDGGQWHGVGRRRGVWPHQGGVWPGHGVRMPTRSHEGCNIIVMERGFCCRLKTKNSDVSLDIIDCVFLLNCIFH